MRCHIRDRPPLSTGTRPGELQRLLSVTQHPWPARVHGSVRDLRTVLHVLQSPLVEVQGDQPLQLPRTGAVVSWAVGFSVLKLGLSWQTETSWSL